MNGRSRLSAVAAFALVVLSAPAITAAARRVELGDAQKVTPHGKRSSMRRWLTGLAVGTQLGLFAKANVNAQDEDQEIHEFPMSQETWAQEEEATFLTMPQMENHEMLGEYDAEIRDAARDNLAAQREALHRTGSVLPTSDAAQDPPEAQHRTGSVLPTSDAAQDPPEVPTWQDGRFPMLESARREAGPGEIDYLRAEAVSPSGRELLRQEIIGDNRFSRRAAVLILSTFGSEATSKEVALLTQGLKDEDWTMRRMCAEALAVLQGVAWPFGAPTMRKVLKDDDVFLRRAAATALGSLEEATPEDIEAVCSVLKDSDWEVRFAAADALGALGKDALQHCEEALNEAAEDENAHVRQVADKALRELERDGIEA